MTHDTCDGCLYHIGGQHCEANLELECADGDREMYKATEDTVFPTVTDAAMIGEREYPKGYYITSVKGGYMLRGER